jgi:acetyl esterase/lipase
MKTIKPTFTIILIAFSLISFSQQEIPLYDGSIPNTKPFALSQIPGLLVYLPKTTAINKTAVIICPGGGYGGLGIQGEGIDAAKWFNTFSIAAFVLKYRLPNEETMIDKSIAPLQDAQRAIQLLRERAGEWGIDTSRIGIMGFSAGGHLASTAGTHFRYETIENKKHTSLRPDFMILAYSVISFADSITHSGSKNNLIGPNPDSSLTRLYSNEWQVTKETPPAFIVHAEDDDGVPVFNSLYFYEALVKNHIPAELIIYPSGGHAFGIRGPMKSNDKWIDRLKDWLSAKGWLSNN